MGEDFTGKIYGRLVVLGKDLERGGCYLLCRCECGNEKSIRKDHLVDGSTKSCGCLRNTHIDLAGKRFDRLLVLREVSRVQKGNKDGYRYYWLCLCDCGKETEVLAEHLIAGNIRSCGCLRNEKAKTNTFIHGMTKTKLFGVWTGFKDRCRNPHNSRYANYGARGIKVCEEWGDFLVFKEWSDNNGYREGLSIERIDNDGPYSPENCRWATKEEQSKNTTRSKFITYNGFTLIQSDWARKLGISISSFKERISKGMPEEDIFFAGSLHDKHNTGRGRKKASDTSVENIPVEDKIRLRNIWKLVKSRCKDLSNSNYGGRGIELCSSWEKFKTFYEWALSSRYSPNLSLDRIDNDNGYSPENCRWVTNIEQANNRRNNVILTYKGVTKTLPDWARFLGIKQATLRARVERGLPEERIFYPGNLPLGNGSAGYAGVTNIDIYGVVQPS